MRVIVNRAAADAVSAKAGRALILEVTRDVKRRAELAAFAGRYATGHLASQIRVRGPNMLPDRVTASVGVWTVRHAAAVEGGAQPHEIWPRGDWPLKFYWRKIMMHVVLPMVSHPGQRPKRYLSDPLREVARLHGMKISWIKR